MEVITRVPPGVSRVVVAIEVDRGDGSPSSPSVPDRAPADAVLAAGRPLPPLLFVTNRDALAGRVGVAEAGVALDMIEANENAVLYDGLPLDPANPAESSAFVGEQLRRESGVRGVVLVGGPTVVPLHRRDCLSPRLRANLGAANDPDEFVVWSDAAYGDADGDLMAEVPVSRVPDGNSADLLISALSASGGTDPSPERVGVRNIARPFAEGVFAALPGSAELLVSEPTTHDVTPPLDAAHVYLMLHGDYADSSRFWGEGTPGNAEAVNLTNVVSAADRVVFTGCCWGALTADQPACWAVEGTFAAGKSAGSSIALEFLGHGSRAYIGCTGAHYSPTEEPYDYFGGPIHHAFWKRLLEGLPPAEALFQAKVDYLAGIPHGDSTALNEAIELKILNQYTCLGLGW